jgi:hypothetical protein
MSIKPIDLQTLFMQMGHVHKQQAAEKDSVSSGENFRRIEAEKKDAKETKTVHAKDDDELTSTQVKSSTEKDDVPMYHEQRHSGKRESEEESADSTEKEVVRDPRLGTNIDISG